MQCRGASRTTSDFSCWLHHLLIMNTTTPVRSDLQLGCLLPPPIDGAIGLSEPLAAPKQLLPVATWSVVSPPRPAPRTLDPLDTSWRKLEAPRPARARWLSRPKSFGAPKLRVPLPAVLTRCVRRPRAGDRSRGRGPQQEQAQERPEERECVPASARQGACPLDRLRLGPGRGAGANFLWRSGQAMMSDARAPTL